MREARHDPAKFLRRLLTSVAAPEITDSHGADRRGY